MSINPCPDKLKRIVFFSLVTLHFSASLIAAAMACDDSGAGIIPSQRANNVAALKVSSC